MATTNVAATATDWAAIKRDFPQLEREVKGKRLVFLDSAASSQKPRSVLAAMDDVYEHHYANIHRGVYAIAEEATAAYEAGRTSAARLIGANDRREVVFTRNTTESINLVAHTWARANLGAGDAVVTTMMEHHANIVPWHMLAEERGVEVRWIPLTADGRLDLTDLGRLLEGAKLVTLAHVSNVLGTINDVRSVADAAHAAGALVLVDAAQSVPHMRVDVTELGCDFLAFSAHKMCGPTGIGVLWARLELLEAMPPFLGGGEMIADVRLDGFTPNEVPHKFEAGTMPIVEAVGLGAAAAYLDAIGFDAVRRHERDLTAYALGALRDRFGDTIRIFGPTSADDRGGVVSFEFAGIHAHDVSQVLDEEGVCVRAGHHCAKPLMRELGVPATARASFYIYNDEADVDALVDALVKTEKFFAA
ncbi:MAG TPA: SufS family cysteine desulfurase [Acidimicrobiia bacterium]|nr:SufS family cysteine desulfurase [Acidimicrobiia bacterium]